MEAARNAFSHRKVQATVTAVNRHAGERFEDPNLHAETHQAHVLNFREHSHFATAICVS